jgi:hypothetical protein
VSFTPLIADFFNGIDPERKFGRTFRSSRRGTRWHIRHTRSIVTLLLTNGHADSNRGGRTSFGAHDGIVTAIRACGLAGSSVAKGMKKISYKGYRFLPEIIQQAIWLYVRFTLSFRDVEDLLAERGIVVSYETVRRWVNHFGPKIAADLRKRHPKPHTTWHLDEVYLKIDSRMV